MALASLLRRLSLDRTALLALAGRMTGQPADTATLDDYLRLYAPAREAPSAP